jgi:glycosyltransferase involved in cell wall biosynthesis
MRVLFLTRYGRLGASSRQRCCLYLDKLHGSGIAAEVCPFLDDGYVRSLHSGRRLSIPLVLRSYARRLATLLQTRRYDLLWIEKEALPWVPAWAELLFWRLAGTSIVADYDDAVFHAYGESPSRLVRFMLGPKIDRLMAKADLVTVGNSYLGRRATAAGARAVAELPTVVDLRHYPERKPVRSGEPFTIVWIGSSLTSSYLEPLRPVLRVLLDKVALRIVLIGAAPGALAELPVERVAWSLDSEAAELAQCDVGIMPLPDLPWERGKCGYKLLQYMASSLPVVASPVGANRQIVVPGETGFLAAGDADWASCLLQLALDPELRRRMGAAGRQRVAEHYSLAATAPRLVELLALSGSQHLKSSSADGGSDQEAGPTATGGPIPIISREPARARH